MYQDQFRAAATKHNLVLWLKLKGS